MHGGMRDRIIIQARDVPQLNREIRRGLPVRSVEGAVFRWVLVDAHGQMEGLLNTSHGSRDVNVDAIRRGANHSQSVSLGETDHRIVIFLCGTKPCRELFHRKELMIRRAGRVVKFLQKIIQHGLIAEREGQY